MSGIEKLFQFAFILALSFGSTIYPADAADFRSLISNGYKIGGLSQSKSGSQGWVLKKGKDTFFCRANVSLVYVGKNGMASFTSSGRMIKLDKETYLNSMNMTHDDTIPRLEDLKAGRPRPEDVGSCTSVR